MSMERQKRIRIWVGSWLLVLWFVPSLGHAGEPFSGDPFDIPQGAYEATFVEDIGAISHIEFSGDYNKSLPGDVPNSPARAVVAQEFYQDHVDEYDFLVAFTTFEIETGEATAFFQPVRNEIEGIGESIFDFSDKFGSTSRLRGFIEMADTGRYELNPFSPNYEDVLGVLSHEVLHSWAAFVGYQDPNGQVSNGLLGRQQAHWSFLLETGASVEYGHRWRDNQDGTFTATDSRRFYSPLDLYLMGMYAPEEVPNFFLIESGDVAATELPSKGTVVSGQAHAVSVNDIISVEGPRVPDYTESQRDFRMAFILLTRPGDPPSSEVISQLQALRESFATRFAIMTGGRGRMHIGPQASPAVPVGMTDVISGDALRTGGASVEDGLAWLLAEQTAAGSWLDKPSTEVRDTAEVYRALLAIDPTVPDLLVAKAFLLAQLDVNTDSLARVVRALDTDATAEQIAELLNRQNADGGWGLNPGDRSDPLDSALAMLALANRVAATSALLLGEGFLAATQNPDGGWPAGSLGVSHVLATAYALQALGLIGSDASLMDPAKAFLIGVQNPDGGFGVSGSSVHETALVVEAMIAAGTGDQVNTIAVRNYLDGQQSEEGSFAGSTYTTGQALVGLLSLDFPNWLLESISTASVNINDGERVPLIVTVRNDGKDSLPATTVAIFDGDPNSGDLLGTVNVPPLFSQQTAQLDFTFDSFDRPGSRRIFALVDAAEAVAERSEADNLSFIDLSVNPAPIGIDLEIAAADIAIIPANPFELPTDLGISVNLRNLGDAAATDVDVELWIGTPGDASALLLETQTLSVAARSNILANFSHTLETSGTTLFTIRIDPTDAIAEVREDNNQAMGFVVTSASVDLVLDPNQIVFLPDPARLGTDVSFEVLVRNRGTSAAPDTAVRYSVTGSGGFFQELQVVPVSLNAGESVLHTVVWRVDRIDSLNFTAEIDVDNMIPELSELNNQASVPFDSIVLSGANLSVDHRDMTFVPDPGLEGMALELNGVVTNSGSDALSDIDVAFFDGDPDNGGAQIGATALIANLAPQASVAVQVQWAEIPSAGDRVIYLVVDPANTILEVDEGDNIAFRDLDVDALPDLAIDAGSISLSPTFPPAGQEISIDVTVANLGAQGASSVLVRAFAGDPNDGGLEIGSGITLASVAAFTSEVASFSHTIPNGVSIQEVHVLVDPSDTIRESKESNNIAVRTVAVQSADAFVTLGFISPDGDSAQDSTVFFFAVGNPQPIDIRILNEFDESVRESKLENGAPIDQGQFEWDGLADSGGVVADGEYRVQAVAAGGDVVAEALVVVDTNRSPLLDALGTPSELFTDLTERLGAIQGFLFSLDGEFLFFTVNDLGQGNVLFSEGVYRARANGTDVTPLAIPSQFNPLGDRFSIEAVSPSGQSVIFQGTNPTSTGCEYFAVGADGTNPRRLPNLTPNDECFQRVVFSDETTLLLLRQGVFPEPTGHFVVKALNLGAGIPTQLAFLNGNEFGGRNALHTVTTDAGLAIVTLEDDSADVTEAILIDLQNGDTTPLGHGAAFSPDGARIAIVDFDSNELRVVSRDRTPLDSIPLGIDLSAGSPGGGGGPSLNVAGAPSLLAFDTAWSDDGRFVAFDASNITDFFCPSTTPGDPGGLYVVDLVEGTVERKTTVTKQVDCGGEIPQSFHVYTAGSTDSVKHGELHFGMQPEQLQLPLPHAVPDADGSLRLRVEQIGHEEAEIDELHLITSRGRVVEPSEARDLSRDVDVLSSVTFADHRVAHALGREFEFVFDGLEQLLPDEKLLLSMRAREASPSRLRVLPFQYPNADRGYAYVVDGDGAILVDGKRNSSDRLPVPVFREYSKPDTGHPNAWVSGYLKSDATYLYAALDFGVDNTWEGVGDYASISIRGSTATEWKTYRIDAAAPRGGTVGFETSPDAIHPHKYYEFQVALADLGAAIGDELEVRFDGYGSAGVLDPFLPNELTPYLFEDGVPAIFGVDREEEEMPGINEETSKMYFLSGQSEILYSSPIVLEGAVEDRGFDSATGPGARGTQIRLHVDPPYTAVFPERIPRGIDLTPGGDALYYWTRRVEGSFQFDRHLFHYRSLLNLTVDLRARRSSSAGGIILEGTASDANLREHQLEFREIADGSPWQPVAPASTIPVVDGRFTTWVPPAVGTFYVRLTATDQAGNQKLRIQRVSWSETPSITGLFSDVPFVSPNGDGSQDAAVLQFTVREPVNLELQILDATGQRIRTIHQSHTVIGEQASLTWDGRDAFGFLVPDGDYRLVVEGFEFFVTIDTAGPILTDISEDLFGLIQSNGNPCTGVSAVCVVELRPEFVATLVEVNLSSIEVESRPVLGGGFEPDSTADLDTELDDAGTIITLTPRPGYDFFDANQPSSVEGAQMQKLATRDYRIVVTDLAGNQAVLPFASTLKRDHVVVTHNGKHQRNRLEDLHHDLDRFTLAAIDFDNVGGFSRRSTELRLSVVETVPQDLQESFLDYRVLGDPNWTEVALVDYVYIERNAAGFPVDPSIALNRRSEHAFHALFDPSTLQPATSYQFRVRMLDGSQTEFVSNGFTLKFDSKAELIVNERNRGISGATSPIRLEFDLPFAIASASLRIESSTDPFFQPGRVVQVLTPAQAAVLTTGRGTVDFDGQLLQACNTYFVSAEILSEIEDGVETSQSVSAVFDAFCFQLELGRPTPIHAEACGDPATNEMLVSMGVINENEIDFELTLLTLAAEDALGVPDIVFSQVKPFAGTETDPFVYEFILDTSSYMDGQEVSLVAELRNDIGESVFQRVALAVDHTPPEVEITFPQEGDRVCATALIAQEENGTENPVSAFTLQARIFDAHESASYEAQPDFITREYNHLTGVVITDPLDAPIPIDPDVFPKYRGGSSGAPISVTRVRRTIVGDLSASGTQRVVEVEGTGAASVRLEVLDYGTFRTCVERAFTVDGEVEGVSASLGAAPILSPNGDGIRDSLPLTLNVDEPVVLDLAVFTTRAATSVEIAAETAIADADGMFVVKDGAALATLASDDPLGFGVHGFEWDGSQDLGGNAPDGSYILELVATDDCLNAHVEAFLVRVDATPPIAQILFPLPADPIPLLVEAIGTVNDTNLASYRLELAAAATPTAFQGLGGGDEVVISDRIASWNTFGLTGDFLLQLSASDLAGNTTTTVVALTLAERQDLLSSYEVLEEFISPNGDGRRDQAQIRFASTDEILATVELLDGSSNVVRTLVADGPYSIGANTLNWDGKNDIDLLVPDGSYTARIVAKLASNPLVTQTESATLVVDATAPAIVIGGITDGALDLDRTLLLSVQDLNLSNYNLEIAPANTGSFQELVSGESAITDRLILLDTDTLPEGGDYLLRATAVDAADTVTTVNLEFLADFIAPVVTIDALAPGTVLPADGSEVIIKGSVVETNLDRYEIILRDSADADQLLVTMNALPVTEDLATIVLNGQPDGDYRLILRAVDRAGREGLAQLSIKIDSTPPTVSLTQPVDGGHLNAAGEIEGSVGDANLQEFELLYSPGAEDNVAAATSLILQRTPRTGRLHTWSNLPADGDYRLYLRAIDQAGSESLISSNFTLDGTPPDAPTNLEISVDANRNIFLNWSPSIATDVVGYHVFRDGVQQTTNPVASFNFTDPDLPEGTYSIEVRAIDAAGNLSETAASGNARVDVTPPTVSLSSPSDGAIVSGAVDITGTAHSVDDFAEYRLSFAPGSPPIGAAQVIASSTLAQLGGQLGQWETLDVGEGIFTLRLEAEDTSGNLASTELAVTIDNAPPTTPENLQALATSNDVDINWDAVPDSDLAGYLLFRGERLVNADGPVVGDLDPFLLMSTSFNDPNLPDGDFTYTVFAMDLAGNISDGSNDDTVSIDLRAPSVNIITPSPSETFDQTLEVEVVSPDEDIDEVVVEIRAAGTADPFVELGRDDSAPYLLTLDTSSLVLGDYELRATATDRAANVDPTPPSVVITRGDLQPPGVPTGLAVSVDGDIATLLWSAPGDVDLNLFEISRIQRANDFFDPNQAIVLDNSAAPLATSFADSGLDDGFYRYELRALDTSDNASLAVLFPEVRVFTPVVFSPLTPTTDPNALVELSSPVAGDLEVTVDRDAGQEIFPIEPIAADTRIVFGPIQLDPNTNVFRARVTDPAGNRSRPGTLVLQRGIPPTAPTGLSLSAASFDVTANWNANPESNILGYQLLREDAPVIPNFGFSFTGITTDLQAAFGSPNNVLAPGGCWNIAPEGLIGGSFELQMAQQELVAGLEFDWLGRTVAAVDFDIDAWNGHHFVPLHEVRDNIVPELEISTLVEFAAPYRTDRFRITILAVRDDADPAFPVGICHVRGDAVPLLTATTFLDIGLLDGSHSYSLRAVNTLAFFSAASASEVVDVGDVVPPEPVVLNGSVANSDVLLRLVASTSTDVVSYTILRDANAVGSVLEDGSGNYNFDDLGVRNGDYDYTVRVVDDVGLESVDSNVFNAIVAVGLPPAPQSLTATPDPFSSSIQLSWTAAPGDLGIGYAIFRSADDNSSFELLAVVTETSYVDFEAEFGRQYFYLVRSLDPVENESADSNEVGTTLLDTIAPIAPSISFPAAGGSTINTSISPIALGGLAEPGTDVFLVQNDEIVGSVPARVETTSETVLLPGGVVTPKLPSALQRHNLATFSVERSVPPFDFETVTVVYDNSTREVFTEVGDNGFDSFGIDADGGFLYYVNVNTFPPQINQVDLANDISIPLDLGVNVFGLANLYVSPTGSKLLIEMASDFGDGLYLHDIALGTSELVYSAPLFDIDSFAVSVSSDDRFAAFVHNGQRVVLDLDTQSFEVLPTSPGSGMHSASWSPDSTQLVYHSDLGGDLDLYSFDVTTGVEVLLSDQPDVQKQPVFSPDGVSVAYIREEAAQNSIVDHRLSDGSETVIYQSTESFESLRWSNTNLLSVNTGFGELRVIEPAGSYLFDAVTLQTAENVFEAIALDLRGNESDPSLPLTINFGPQSGVDLSARLVLVPEIPYVGAEAIVELAVSNEGVLEALGPAVDLFIVDPSLGVLRLIDTQQIASLAAGEELVFAFGWVPDQPGEHFVVAAIDPENAIAESVLGNNGDVLTVNVSPDSVPMVELGLSRSELEIDSDLVIDLTLRNPGPVFMGTAELRIVDAVDAAAVVFGTDTVELASGNTVVRQEIWNSSRTFAGLYDVLAEVRNAAGETIASTRVPIEILEERQLILGFSSDRAAYADNELAAFTASIVRPGGNSVIAGASATLRVMTGATEVFTDSTTIGALLPDGSSQVVFQWNTGLAIPGPYSAEVELEEGGELLAQSSTNVAVVQSVPRVEGALIGLAPAIPSGGSIVFSTRLQNSGNSAITGVQVTVTLRDARTLATVTTQNFNVNLPIGLPVEQPINFDASALAIGSYQVQLVSDSPNGGQMVMQELATQTVALVDASAPTIAILAPDPNQWVNSNTDSVVIEAIDTEEGIDRVELSIDDAEFVTVPAGSGNAFIFDLGGVSEAPHSVVAQAFDRAGNESPLVGVGFRVDNAHPTVTINGVVEGVLTTNSVTATVDIFDTNLVTSSIELNGEPYVSGTEIVDDNFYVLSASGEDLAGNIGGAVVRFTIDTENPMAPLITSHSNGEFLEDEVIEIAGLTEPNITVTMTFESDDTIGVADPNGVFRFSGIPLRKGANEFSFVATDLVGFDSPSTELKLHSLESNLLYSQIHWLAVDPNLVPTDPNRDGITIDITLRNAFRRDRYSECIDRTTGSLTACSSGDGFPGLGDVFAETAGFTRLNLGEGDPVLGSQFGALLYIVTAIDPSRNLVEGVALDSDQLPAIQTRIPHTYATTGDFIISPKTPGRISGNGGSDYDGVNDHLNNPDSIFRAESLVNETPLNTSPVATLPPIVDCPIDGVCRFAVPALDADGDSLTYRLAAPMEAAGSGTFVQPGPPFSSDAAAIDPNTGEFTWDTTGAVLAADPNAETLYSTQLVVEDGFSRSSLEFMIRLVPAGATIPQVEARVGGESVCGTVREVSVGQVLRLDLHAEDSNGIESVTLNVAGLPVSAMTTPGLPVSEASVDATLVWTPSTTDLGAHVLNFYVSSENAGFATCDLRVEVLDDVALLPLDHFLFYKVSKAKSVESFIKFGPIVLTDQHGQTKYNVIGLKQLGNPADRNGEGIGDAETHLVEYKVKAIKGTPKFNTVSDIPMVNQCHDANNPVYVKLVKPSSLLVPSSKSLDDPNVLAPEIANHVVDHYLCYIAKSQRTLGPEKIRLPKFPKGIQVALTDQFDLPDRIYDLKGISKVCVPVDKRIDPSTPPELLASADRGQSVVIEPASVRFPDDHLLCYKAKLATKTLEQSSCGALDPRDNGVKIEPKQPAHQQIPLFTVNSQFGANSLATKREFEFCMPSRSHDSPL